MVALRNRNRTRSEPQIIPLTAEVQEITATGNLTIVFNKKVIIPPIRVYSDESRMLKDNTNSTFYYEIMDVVSIKVDSGFFDAGDAEI